MAVTVRAELDLDRRRQRIMRRRLTVQYLAAEQPRRPAGAP